MPEVKTNKACFGAATVGAATVAERTSEILARLNPIDGAETTIKYRLNKRRSKPHASFISTKNILVNALNN